MDLTPNAEQQQIIDSVTRILERNGGYKRAQAQVEEGAYDHALHGQLADGGFFSLPVSEGTGPLEAALAVERIAFHGGLVAAGATGLVYPEVTGRAADGPVALAPAKPGAPFRLGQFAKTILIDDGGDRALELSPRPGDLNAADNDHAGWPLASLTQAAIDRAERLGPGSGEALRNWWRVALAAEAAGAMRAAIGTTARYLTDRVQFGRPLATFQSLQHRLAQLAVQTEGVYWLAMEAAAQDADAMSAAAAAAHATVTAPLVLRESQQMHGAMGFTREYHLHVWTMRLPALQRELGGMTGHARFIAKELAAG